MKRLRLLLVWCCCFCARAGWSCNYLLALLTEAIDQGDLSGARFHALEALQGGCDEGRIANLYISKADKMLEGATGVVFNGTVRRVKPQADETDCWNFEANQLELWDKCCSPVETVNRPHKQMPGSDLFLSTGDSNASSDACYRQGTLMCCEFHEESSSYLRLPALRELALRIRIKFDDGSYDYLDMEQDGFLRLYDTAGVLWPTGYLLALCLASPTFCGVPELYSATDSSLFRTLELGAGIGLPCIALSRMLNKTRRRGEVVCADKAPQALSLTASNARAAHASSVVTTKLDHYNTTAVMKMRTPGFSLILGSSLQGLFDEDHLWIVLDLLLVSDPNSLVLLAHSIHSLEIPASGKFRRMRTISGDRFGMTTRWGKSSDFQISVLCRRDSGTLGEL